MQYVSSEGLKIIPRFSSVWGLVHLTFPSFKGQLYFYKLVMTTWKRDTVYKSPK